MAPPPAPEDRCLGVAADRSWWCTTPVECAACPTVCMKDPLFRIPCLDDCVDSFEQGKDASCFKLGASAYHWFNYQNKAPNDFTYGYPTAKGTYFYQFTADFECCTCSTKYGGHAALRARDQSTFRSFFEEKVWFYELYAWLDAGWGKIKAGKVWKRFGLDWDGTFWGNVAYYDGMKLDPDFGASWERTYEMNQRLSLDAYLQYFVEEDTVNGSIAGADPESTKALREKNTFVARIMPTLKLDNHQTFAVGVSGLTGTVEAAAGGDTTLTQWAVDATYTWCGLKVFGEYAYSDGIQNPAHYVTGGPSKIYKDYLFGAEYKLGAFTPRVVYSHGDYENPGGSQDLLVAGASVELTKYLTFMFEYVKWDVKPAAGGTVPFEDSLNFILNWHL
jgi:hypothetical protein